MRNKLFMASCLAGLGIANTAQAHIQLSSPTARFTQDDQGLKTGPCGSGAATGKVTPLVPGQTLTVTWKESVPHAGHYRIALSANVSDFVEPTNLTIPTTLAAWDLADGIADKTGTQNYTQDVKIPDQECPACVLQLLQIMSGGTDGTNTGTFSGVYHACADLNISAANADAGTKSDAGGGSDARMDLARRDGAAGDATAQATGGTSGSGGSSGTGGGGAGNGGGSGAGGASSSGGAGGTGGAAGSGGTAGTGGSGTGGSSTAGGSSGAGGRPGSGGSSGGGGAPGTGGSSASGGSSATTVASASGGTSGTGGSSGTNAAPTDDAGCKCNLGARSAPTSWVVASLLALLFGLRRKQRPDRARR